MMFDSIKQNLKKIWQYLKFSFFFWFLLIFFIVFVIVKISNNSTGNEYLKDVSICEAQVVSTKTDMDSSETGYYIKVNLISNYIVLDEEQSWFQVTKDFYNICQTQKTIGVLVGNFDVFKNKYFGLFGDVGQTFVKSNYGIVDVFNSVDAANQAYPHKTFTADAQLIKKINEKDDGYFFVLSYDQREMTMQVSSEIYNKYNENDKVSCNFDGIGDFIKIVGVK